MVVQHNLPAVNANRQYGINNNKLAKNLEKLSSGYRINRASDDAAGLAISEKMRGQISGLDQATRNAQDGISLIQTAEGALQETHSILQRMRELAVQSANGTYKNEVDRENIQKEVEALKSEIDRISTSTHYNGIQLLDGSQSSERTNIVDSSVNALAGDNAPVDIAKNPPVTAALGSSANFTVATGAAGAPELDGTVAFADADFAEAIGDAATMGKAIDQLYTDNVTISYDNLEIRFDDTAADHAVSDNVITLSTSALKTATSGKTAVADLNIAIADAIEGKIGSTRDYAKGTAVDADAKFSFSAKDGKTILDPKSGASKVQDASWTIDFSAYTTGDMKAGSTIAIDGKNYTFVDDSEATVKAGDIKVFVGDKKVEAASGTELANALYTAVKSQTISGNTNKISIKDEGGVGSETGELTITAKKGAVANGTVKVEGTFADGYKTSFDSNNFMNGDTLSITSAVGSYNLVVGEDIKIGASATDIATAFTNKINTQSGGTDTTTSVTANADGTLKSTNEIKSNMMEKNGIIFQIGANGTADQRVELNIDDMSAKNLGSHTYETDMAGNKIEGTGVLTSSIKDISVGTRESANDAIAVIDDAINQVSGTRADLGALQNRMEHTINSLGVASENLTSAESRIRDLDMAKEMMDFTKNQIISQASQSMLAQANSLPQGVLQLLQ